MVAVSTGALGSTGAMSDPGGKARAVTNMLRLGRRTFALLFAIVTVAYIVLPDLRAPLLATLAALSAGAIVYGVVLLRPQRKLSWLLLAISVVILGIGDTMATLSGPLTQVRPSTSGVLFLTTYVPLALALLGLGRPVVPTKDWPTVLDTIALSLAGGLLVWIVLVRPAVVGANMDGIGKAGAIATWVGYVAVVAACARLLMLWRANVAANVLVAGVAAYLVSDFLYGSALVRGMGVRTTVVDIGFIILYGLAGLAALLPSMCRIATHELAYPRYELGPRRLFVLAVTLLIAPSALLIEATSGPVTAGIAIAIVSGIVGLLMLLRLALGAQAYRRRGLANQAVRSALRSMVVATAATEVTASLTAALRAMLPRSTGAHAFVAEHGKRGPSQPLSTRLILTERADGLGELLVKVGADALPVAGAYAIMFTAPLKHLIEQAPTLEALAEQAGAALARIDLVGALQVEERERYFRTLVLTSTDATLICRHDRIDYATPSAAIMFGRDVHGLLLSELFDAEPLAPNPDESIVDEAEGREGTIRRPDGTVRAVLVQERDLTRDPTVNGVVVTVRDVTAERDLQRSLAYRASHDALTGLANSERLREQLRLDRDRAGRDSLCAVLFVDLDDFKQVNDTYGHEVGDGLLVNVAYRIRACLRADDLAARLGGDEFAALLRDVPDEQSARRTARRIADTLSRPVQVAGITLDSRASVGLAIARTPGEFDSLLRRADTALYTAKADGKGHWREYRDGMISPIRRRNDLRVELENAMRDDTLAVHYQPIVDLETGRAVGFEALIRFDRAEGGTIPPHELIRIAEENGLIVPLGDWVVMRALADVARLNPGNGGPPPYVSVNVSPNQLRHSGFTDSVRAALGSSGVDPHRLVLEITERLLVAEEAQAWRFLNELRDLGVRVAIDDYGTGCASLSYLRQPAIDIVKIDRSFVDHLDAPRGYELLEAMVNLTVQLGLTQIAEGVQDAHARDVLRDMGCRHGQGYFYSAALPLSQVAAWTGLALTNDSA